MSGLKEISSLAVITRDARMLKNKWIGLGSPGLEDERRKNEGFFVEGGFWIFVLFIYLLMIQSHCAWSWPNRLVWLARDLPFCTTTTTTFDFLLLFLFPWIQGIKLRSSCLHQKSFTNRDVSPSLLYFILFFSEKIAIPCCRGHFSLPSAEITYLSLFRT